MVTDRIPMDDRMLEMEEVEGLLFSPSKQTQKPLSTNSTSICTRAYHGRWGMCLLTIIAAVCVLFSADSKQLRFWEGTRGEHVDDIQYKEKLEAERKGNIEGQREHSTLAPTVMTKPTATPMATTTTIIITTAPTVITAAPTATTMAPTVITAAPTATTMAPTNTITAAPFATTLTPTATTAVPTTITTAPTATTMTPTLTTAAPTEPTTPIIFPIIIPGDTGPTTFPKPDQIVRITRPGAVERQAELAKEWGKWEFTDPNLDSRPKQDYCAEYPNRDIPRDKFPANAWQADTEYLAKFLDEGIKLVDRAMEAILAEYGKGKKDKQDEDFTKRAEMFQMSFLNFTNGDKPYGGKEVQSNGGWITQRSLEGLKRRLWHALITNDSFTVTLGGHSAAAGHGNNFKQSYIMQFHKIMEPLLAMLNVTLTSRNLAHGGLGTLQNALGARSIYGDEIDVMIWDSGMTEGRDGGAIDLFARQALIGGNRVPLLFGGNFYNLQMLHDTCGADVAQYGSALLGIDICEDEAQALTIPYAERYMKCTTERTDLCGSHRFDSICWPENYTGPIVPDAKQDLKPGSQVQWHPGNLVHQLTGRNLAMSLLFALKEALYQWKEMPDFALPDELWHVSDYYANIRKKVRELPRDLGDCVKAFDGKLPSRVCNTPLNGATEFTPRANPDKTSIQSLIKPAENGYIPHMERSVQYNGPEPYNSKLDPPEGAIDVLAIISNGRDYGSTFHENRRLDSEPPRLTGSSRVSRRLDGDIIKPGLGWFLSSLCAGYCDGTWNSECGRESGSKCLLLGHSDGRGGIIMDGYGGWLMLKLPAVKEGIIILKIETWHDVVENPITAGWHSENNKTRRLRHANFPSFVDTSTRYDTRDSETDDRRLKAEPPGYCDEFRFEYAIEGKVTSLDKDAFTSAIKPVQRVVEVLTILDDSNYIIGEARPIEVALRMIGCHDTTKKAMKLTHLYWA